MVAVPSPSSRLAELASRYALDERAVAALQALLRSLESDETAPTTVREPDRALDVHLADSLVALELDAVRAAGSIADLGAGAGFPGLALAAALPGTRVYAVESVGRKGAFMQRAIDAAGLENASVVVARAEEWVEGFRLCDVVTARALAPLDVLAEYAAPLLRVGGTLVAWKGVRDPAEEAAGERAAAVLGLEVGEIRRVDPFRKAEHRHLHLYTKVKEPPPRFPRRAGMARKRPLGRLT
jgi:16S rRNA (guanine527-N7)-methyltransferase